MPRTRNPKPTDVPDAVLDHFAREGPLSAADVSPDLIWPSCATGVATSWASGSSRPKASSSGWGDRWPEGHERGGGRGLPATTLQTCLVRSPAIVASWRRAFLAEFVDSAAGDFRLRSGSRYHTAATDGSMLGAGRSVRGIIRRS
jgi:hypothetical protein